MFDTVYWFEFADVELLFVFGLDLLLDVLVDAVDGCIYHELWEERHVLLS